MPVDDGRLDRHHGAHRAHGAIAQTFGAASVAAARAPHAALAGGHAQQHQQPADRLVPGQALAQERHARDRREDRHEVGHGRCRGRARVADDRVVEQVGGARPDRAERRDRGQRPDRDRAGNAAGERQHERELQRPHGELPEREHRHREPARREVAPQVREADAVEDRRGQAGGAAYELAAADAAPRAQHDQHAREAERETEGALPRRALLGQGQEHDGEHEERRRPVPDAREQRRDVLLTEREQRERRAVDEHCGDAQVQPRAPIARQAAALREQRRGQRQQAEQHPPERDLHRGEAPVADLDEHERHAPDARPAARHAALPTSSPRAVPRHAPSTTSTPAKPIARPITRSRVGRSSGSVNSTTSSTNSGVVPFQMPARTDETCCSPNANSVNGALLTRNAATARCAQVRRSRGSRPRCASTTGASASSPNSMRPNETCTGVKPRLPISMSTNDIPQIAPSNSNRAGHGSLRALMCPSARARAGSAWPRAHRRSR